MKSFAVVIATFNRAAAVERAVASVLRQSLRPLEVIVVDDGSTDDTVRQVARLGHGVQIVQRDNGERGAARNTGVAQATADVVAFLDSDDEWEVHHLETLAAHWLPSAAVVHTGARMVDDEQQRVFHVTCGRERRPLARRLHDVIMDNPVPFSSSSVRRDLFKVAGGFSENRIMAGGGEDWHLWMRLAAHGTIVAVPEVTTTVHFHAGNTVGDLERHLAGLEVVRREILDGAVVPPNLRTRALVGTSVRMARVRREAGHPRDALAGLRADVRKYPGMLSHPRPLSRVAAGAVRDMMVR